MHQFLKKQVERTHYINLRFSISIVKSLAKLFYYFPWVIFKSNNKKDFLFLPYYPKNNAGCIVRFQNYLPFFENENYTYDISYIGTHKELFEIMQGEGEKIQTYKYYRKILWKRFFIVINSKNYDAIYIQRCVYPMYPDLKNCFLGKLLFKLNDNITIDFYDADYIINEKLVKSSAKYSKNISVVNTFLENYFNKINNNVFIHPIALDKKFYKKKINYKIEKITKIVWCGTSGHFKNLRLLDDVFLELSKKFNFKLVVISHKNYNIKNINVENIKFKLEEFTNTLYNCDIAIFPVKYINDIQKGAMAMKVLEYSATGLPVVGTPIALSPFFNDNEDLLLANNKDEWYDHLSNLIQNEKLRKHIGENIYQKFIKYHSLEKSYKNLKKILETTS